MLLKLKFQSVVTVYKDSGLSVNLDKRVITQISWEAKSEGKSG
jgi:hypothetical protein